MLTSLILGLSVLLTASLPGIDLALHAITKAKETQQAFAEKTRQLLPSFTYATKNKNENNK